MTFEDTLASLIDLQRESIEHTQEFLQRSAEYQRQVTLAILDEEFQAFDSQTGSGEADRLQSITEELKFAVEVASFGTYEWNVQTDEVRFTEAWATLFGYNLETIDNTLDAWLDRCHPKDRSELETALSAALDGDTDYYDVEHRMQTASGEWIWGRTIGRVVERDADGTPRQVVGIHLDVDEQKQAQRALERKRDMFAQGPAVVFKLRYAAGWPIEYVSENVEALLGYTPDQLESGDVTYTDLLYDADRKRVTEHLHSHADGTIGRVRHDPYRLVTSDGDIRWMIGYSKPIRVGEQVTHLLGYLIDITERKEIEQHLAEQRDNLETLNEVVCHDIRNDLQVAKTYATLLEDHVDDEGTAHLATLQESVESAITLTQTAGDLASVILHSDSDASSVTLSETLGPEIDDIQSNYPDAELTVEDSIADITVAGDELVGSVFRNLLTNAVKHNDKEVPKIRVGIETKDEHVKIRVADNGPSIPDEYKQTIFDKGEQRLESEGTGVGLCLVESLLDRYGGDVWIEDNNPDGSIFVVRLPYGKQ